MLCGEALSPGVCPALHLFSVLAAFLQRPKSFPRHLQHFCKVQKVFRSTCGTSAKTIFSVLTLEEFLQAFPKVIFPLVCSIFGHSARIGTKRAGPAMSNRKPCFVYQRKTDAPGERCAVFMSSILRSQPSAHPPERSRLP